MALLAAIAAVVLVVAASVSSGLPENATRVTAPGTARITLAEPGTYTISYEYQSAGDGHGSAPAEVASMLLELVPADSATRVPIRRLPGDFTSSEGSTQDLAIDEFSIDHAGSYSLVSRYAGRADWEAGHPCHSTGLDRELGPPHHRPPGGDHLASRRSRARSRHPRPADSCCLAAAACVPAGTRCQPFGDAVRHRDSERLLVHGRFLEQVFGASRTSSSYRRPSENAGSSQHDKKSA